VPVLSKIGVDSQALLAEARRQIDCLPALWAGGALKAEPSWAASEVLGQAFEEAADLNDEHVSTEHLLLAIMALENDPAQALLARHGASREVGRPECTDDGSQSPAGCWANLRSPGPGA